jgi:hypothetical protein
MIDSLCISAVIYIEYKSIFNKDSKLGNILKYRV